MSMPIIFIIPGACSLGSQITLEWLQIPYQIGITTPEIRQSAQFKQINPSGKVGALKDGEIVLGENLAILLYLADKFTASKICQQVNTLGRLKVYQWLSFLSSTLHPTFQHFNYPARFISAEHSEELRESALERLLTHLAYIDQQLLPSGYFLGDEPGIVDAQAYGLIRWCRHHLRGNDLVDISRFAQLNRFLHQMTSLEAVQNALALEHSQPELLVNSKFSGYFEFS